jgi:hypothetical protein
MKTAKPPSQIKRFVRLFASHAPKITPASFFRHTLRTLVDRGSRSTVWPQTVGAMAKGRHATSPTNHRRGLSQPDKNEKTRFRMIFEGLPSPIFVCVRKSMLISA